MAEAVEAAGGSRDLVGSDKQLRFVFKEFPIFGGESDLAAKTALSAPGKARGLELYRTFMAEKALDAAAILAHVRHTREAR